MKRSPRGPACLERDVLEVLPALPGRFTAGDVGRVLMAQGRGYSERVGVLARLERAGHITLVRQEASGYRTRHYRKRGAT